jgi:hypothetical protein
MPAMRRMILAVGLLLGACGGGEVATGEPDAGVPPPQILPGVFCRAASDCPAGYYCDVVTAETLNDFPAAKSLLKADNHCRLPCVDTIRDDCSMPACEDRPSGRVDPDGAGVECGLDTRPVCNGGIVYNAVEVAQGAAPLKLHPWHSKASPCADWAANTSPWPFAF